MMDIMSISGAATGMGVAALAIAHRPLAKWGRKVRRRRGGVYLWRVDHHRNRARRVTGYVGETVSYHFRSQQHMGVSHYSEMGKSRMVAPVKVPAQPWSDLNPRMYKVLPLPWWMCWKWILRPLETLVILCTWPVYNDAKNRWNPRRIPKAEARIHRLQRDQGRIVHTLNVLGAHALRRLFIALLVTVLCLAAYVWAIYS